jgi:hypothetical protein
MEEKLEQLRQEMINARLAYEDFQIQNSRELTEEEKLNEMEYPTFGEFVEQSPSRMFSVTVDNLNDFNELRKNMETTRVRYMEEYVKINQNNQ